MKNFDWFGLAPYGAGSPPAFVLAINLYNSVMTVVDNRLWIIGAFVAVLGIVGMMAVEIGTYKMLARAFADRQWKAAGLALIGACIVTGMIIFSVYTGADTKSLFSSTGVMLIGYLAIMVREYLERNKSNAATVVGVDLERARLEVELERQKAAAERAKARAAKSAKVSESNPKVSETFGNDWRKIPAEHRAKIAGMTVKQISTTYLVSERTALNWQKYAQDEQVTK